MYADAVRHVRDHPGDWMAGLGRKLAYFVWFRPSAGSSYRFLGGLRDAARTLLMLAYASLLPFALAGLWLTRHRWRALVPLHLTVVAYTGTAVLFFSATRFRTPLEALLVVMAARSVAWVVDRAPSPYGRRPSV